MFLARIITRHGNAINRRNRLLDLSHVLDDVRKVLVRRVSPGATSQLSAVTTPSDRKDAATGGKVEPSQMRRGEATTPPKV